MGVRVGKQWAWDKKFPKGYLHRNFPYSSIDCICSSLDQPIDPLWYVHHCHWTSETHCQPSPRKKAWIPLIWKELSKSLSIFGSDANCKRWLSKGLHHYRPSFKHLWPHGALQGSVLIPLASGLQDSLYCQLRLWMVQNSQKKRSKEIAK